MTKYYSKPEIRPASKPSAPRRIYVTSPSRSRSLVWVDMEPMLKDERSRCDKAARELERAKRRLEHFQNECEPAFSRWFHGRFGGKVTRVRELQARAAELDQLISSVRTEALFTGCSERTAYARLEEMKQRARKFDDGDEPFGSDRDETAGDDDEEEFPPELEEMLRRGFESLYGAEGLSPGEYAEMFERFKQNFEEEMLGQREWRDGHSRAEARKAAETRSKADSELARRKQVYRELARRLHPDLNSGLTARERELWHEVQAAYESKDLERLETLAAIVESGSEAGFSKVRSVSRLRAILQDFGRKLKAARKTLRLARSEPAWNFIAVQKDDKKLSGLARRISQDLDEALEVLEQEVASFERQVERWKSRPRGRKRQGMQKQSRGSGRSRRQGHATMTKAEMDAYTGFGDKD